MAKKTDGYKIVNASAIGIPEKDSAAANTILLAISSMKPGDAIEVSGAISYLCFGNQVSPDRVWRQRAGKDKKRYVVCYAK